MRLLVTIALLLTYGEVWAQADSFHVWNKWCSRKDTLLLFYGGNNTIQVYCKNHKPGDLKLKSLDKTLRIGQPEISGDTLSVLAMPYPGKSKIMRLVILGARNNKILKTLTFTSDSIPAPEARLGSIQKDESFKKTILSQTKLRVIFPNSLYSYPYTIRQYTFKSRTNKGEANLVVNSFMLNTPVLTAINETPDGGVIEFTNIRATCPECATRTLTDLKLKIKTFVADTAPKKTERKQ
jgi:hypothetical protein